MSRFVLALSGLGLTAIAAPLLLKPTPVVLWNATASAPIGLYRVQHDRTARVGDWLAAWPPTRLAPVFAIRRYLPLGVPLVKQVAALAPAVVCRFGATVTINGRPAASARDADHLGRALPSWRGCRPLAADEIFLLNPAPDSLDGRYFGPISTKTVVGRLAPLWVAEPVTP